MPTDFEFRKLLLDIADKMTETGRREFVFLLGDDIPRRKQDEPLIEIFQILINVGRISETDCSYLIQMLEAAKLTVLAFEVARFENRNSPMISPSISSSSEQPIELNEFIETSTRTISERQIPTAQDLLNDFHEDDKLNMAASRELQFENYGSITRFPSTSTISEPDLPVLSLSFQDIDLKIFKYEPWSAEFLQEINITIVPYDYQRELVQTAIKAKNTIICLPTGGGKTFVAALLIKYYLIEKSTSANRKKFTGFFVVPRRAMVKQQTEKLKQFGNLRVIAGEDFYNITQYLQKSDVIVCTPQQLLDCLKSKTISMSNIDVLCFDECHDLVARHQYVGIMQYLLCTNIDSISPIILGLTAGIGLHGSGVARILPNFIHLCAMFDCTTITTVWKTESEDELNRLISSSSNDEIICVDKHKAYDLLRISIKKDLEELILQLFLNKQTNPSQIFPEKDVDMNGYEQNLELLKQSEQKNQNFSFGLLINYILPIYRHVKALMDLTPELVLSDLRDYFQMIYQTREHPTKIDTLIYVKCQELFKKKLTELEESEKNLSNPKLDKLVELLKKHAEKANNRVLILVERTFYAEKICEFLQNHSELKNIIKPCWLTSQNSTASRNAKKNENSVLKDFQTGTCNVLISTDIVQAGLDIPPCSLVLRYDFVPDSIGTVQARVRARAVDCHYCLITTKDSSNYKKEIENRERELDLKEALEAWKRYPSSEFKSRVIEMKTSLINEWTENLNQAIKAKETISKRSELTGDVLCRACGYALGRLENLRQNGPAYFVYDQDFYDRIEEKMYPEPEEFGRTLVTGKALCGSKKCRAELGRIQLFKGYSSLRTIYPLKCASIKIRQIDKDTAKEVILLKKKWSAMPFVIPPLELPQSHNNDDDDDFYDANENPSTD